MSSGDSDSAIVGDSEQQQNEEGDTVGLEAGPPVPPSAPPGGKEKRVPPRPHLLHTEDPIPTTKYPSLSDRTRNLHVLSTQLTPASRRLDRAATRRNRRDQAPPGTVVIYARVSTELQADLGLSLENQVARCESYCEAFGLQIVDVFEETASGKSLHRWQLEKALNTIADGQAAGLVVHKLDRLTRSVRDLGILLDHPSLRDGSLHSVSERLDTSTPSGRLMLHMLASVAQWERETIRDRICQSFERMRATGRVSSERHVPYGYAKHKRTLIENPEEQKLIRRIFELAEIVERPSELVRQLAAEGWRGRNGKPLARTQIGRILTAQQRVAFRLSEDEWQHGVHSVDYGGSSARLVPTSDAWRVNPEEKKAWRRIKSWSFRAWRAGEFGPVDRPDFGEPEEPDLRSGCVQDPPGE